MWTWQSEMREVLEVKLFTERIWLEERLDTTQEIIMRDMEHRLKKFSAKFMEEKVGFVKNEKKFEAEKKLFESERKLVEERKLLVEREQMTEKRLQEMEKELRVHKELIEMLLKTVPFQRNARATENIEDEERTIKLKVETNCNAEIEQLIKICKILVMDRDQRGLTDIERRTLESQIIFEPDKRGLKRESKLLEDNKVVIEKEHLLRERSLNERKTNLSAQTKLAEEKDSQTINQLSVVDEMKNWFEGEKKLLDESRRVVEQKQMMKENRLKEMEKELKLQTEQVQREILILEKNQIQKTTMEQQKKKDTRLDVNNQKDVQKEKQETLDNEPRPKWATKVEMKEKTLENAQDESEKATHGNFVVLVEEDFQSKTEAATESETEKIKPEVLKGDRGIQGTQVVVDVLTYCDQNTSATLEMPVKVTKMSQLSSKTILNNKTALSGGKEMDLLLEELNRLKSEPENPKASKSETQIKETTDWTGSVDSDCEPAIPINNKQQEAIPQIGRDNQKVFKLDQDKPKASENMDTQADDCCPDSDVEETQVKKPTVIKKITQKSHLCGNQKAQKKKSLAPCEKEVDLHPKEPNMLEPEPENSKAPEIGAQLKNTTDSTGSVESDGKPTIPINNKQQDAIPLAERANQKVFKLDQETPKASENMDTKAVVDCCSDTDVEDTKDKNQSAIKKMTQKSNLLKNQKAQKKKSLAPCEKEVDLHPKEPNMLEPEPENSKAPEIGAQLKNTTDSTGSDESDGRPAIPINDKQQEAIRQAERANQKVFKLDQDKPKASGHMDTKDGDCCSNSDVEETQVKDQSAVVKKITQKSHLCGNQKAQKKKSLPPCEKEVDLLFKELNMLEPEPQNSKAPETGAQLKKTTDSTGSVESDGKPTIPINNKQQGAIPQAERANQKVFKLDQDKPKASGNMDTKAVVDCCSDTDVEDTKDKNQSSNKKMTQKSHLSANQKAQKKTILPPREKKVDLLSEELNMLEPQPENSKAPETGAQLKKTTDWTGSVESVGKLTIPINNKQHKALPQAERANQKVFKLDQDKPKASGNMDTQADDCCPDSDVEETQVKKPTVIKKITQKSHLCGNQKAQKKKSLAPCEKEVDLHPKEPNMLEPQPENSKAPEIGAQLKKTTDSTGSVESDGKPTIPINNKQQGAIPQAERANQKVFKLDQDKPKASENMDTKAVVDCCSDTDVEDTKDKNQSSNKKMTQKSHLSANQKAQKKTILPPCEKEMDLLLEELNMLEPQPENSKAPETGAQLKNTTDSTGSVESDGKPTIPINNKQQEAIPQAERANQKVFKLDQDKPKASENMDTKAVVDCCSDTDVEDTKDRNQSSNKKMTQKSHLSANQKAQKKIILPPREKKVDLLSEELNMLEPQPEKSKTPETGAQLKKTTDWTDSDESDCEPATPISDKQQEAIRRAERANRKAFKLYQDKVKDGGNMDTQAVDSWSDSDVEDTQVKYQPPRRDMTYKGLSFNYKAQQKNIAPNLFKLYQDKLKDSGDSLKSLKAKDLGIAHGDVIPKAGSYTYSKDKGKAKLMNSPASKSDCSVRNTSGLQALRTENYTISKMNEERKPFTYTDSLNKTNKSYSSNLLTLNKNKPAVALTNSDVCIKHNGTPKTEISGIKKTEKTENFDIDDLMAELGMSDIGIDKDHQPKMPPQLGVTNKKSEKTENFDVDDLMAELGMADIGIDKDHQPKMPPLHGVTNKKSEKTENFDVDDLMAELGMSDIGIDKDHQPKMPLQQEKSNSGIVETSEGNIDQTNINEKEPMIDIASIQQKWREAFKQKQLKAEESESEWSDSTEEDESTKECLPSPLPTSFSLLKTEVNIDQNKDCENEPLIDMELMQQKITEGFKQQQLKVKDLDSDWTDSTDEEPPVPQTIANKPKIPQTSLQMSQPDPQTASLQRSQVDPPLVNLDKKMLEKKVPAQEQVADSETVKCSTPKEALPIMTKVERIINGLTESEWLELEKKQVDNCLSECSMPNRLSDGKISQTGGGGSDEKHTKCQGKTDKKNNTSEPKREEETNVPNLKCNVNTVPCNDPLRVLEDILGINIAENKDLIMNWGFIQPLTEPEAESKSKSKSNIFSALKTKKDSFFQKRSEKKQEKKKEKERLKQEKLENFEKYSEMGKQWTEATLKKRREEKIAKKALKLQAKKDKMKARNLKSYERAMSKWDESEDNLRKFQRQYMPATVKENKKVNESLFNTAGKAQHKRPSSEEDNANH